LLDRGPVAEKVLAERIFEPNFSRLRELLDKARGDGRIREDVDPAVAISLLAAGCVFFFQSRDVLRHLPGASFAQSPEAFSQMMVDIVMHGISPR
jgi:TetR/AcrR family transcriptional regulator